MTNYGAAFATSHEELPVEKIAAIAREFEQGQRSVAWLKAELRKIVKAVAPNAGNEEAAQLYVQILKSYLGRLRDS